MRSQTETVVFDCDGTDIAASITGSGPPLLLLHGYPETKAMWDAITPLLAKNYTVVAADLRGYGDSARPLGEVYSKREMSRDQVILMHKIGFERFAVVGHDRGGRVAHRMALDQPDAISSIAVLDIVPTLHMFDNVDRAMATSYFHWFFLARSGGVPEALIGANPKVWLNSRFAGRNPERDGFVPAAFEEYLRCFDSESIRATCSDYRAAATVDLEHDRRDRDEKRVVSAPLLALWGAHSYVGRNFDVVEVWSEYGFNVRGQALDAEHYLAEEAPDATAEALLRFLNHPEVTL